MFLDHLFIFLKMVFSMNTSILKVLDSEMSVVEKQKRPWMPFKSIPIRLMGTLKTTKSNSRDKPYGRRNVSTGNGLDTVRGCPGGETNDGFGCWWGCYSKEAMKRFRILFDIPISMKLVPHLLENDLKNLDDDWIRNGIHGDPSIDWELTLKVCRLAHKYHKKTVVLTRFWRMATQQQLDQLAEYNVILHGTICALDSNEFRKHILYHLDSYHGKSVARVVTFAFRNSVLMDLQESLMNYSLSLEQPGRLQTTNPTWKLVDHSKYHNYISYTTMKPNPRWQTAGVLYPNKDSCSSPCWSCPHKCMTR